MSGDLSPYTLAAVPELGLPLRDNARYDDLTAPGQALPKPDAMELDDDVSIKQEQTWPGRHQN